jgi:hypothetical protein
MTGTPLATILRLNAARTIDLSRYEEEGNFDRFGYIKDLAENHGADLATVIEIADLLGPEEDFDGLVTTIEDAAEGFGFGAIISGRPMSAATDTLGDQIVAAGLAANSFLWTSTGRFMCPKAPFLPRGICLRACSGAARIIPPRRASRVKLV